MRALRQADLEVFADYHQFYLQDGGVNPAAPEDWSDEDILRRAKVAEHVVVVCPLRNMTVPVRVSLLTRRPAVDLAAYDHAVEASLALPTGRLQVHECTGGEVLAWSVEPGSYRLIALFSALGSISPNGLEGEDKYEVLLWQGPPTPLAVLKQWSQDGDG